jgi:hypothetical protein
MAGPQNKRQAGPTSAWEASRGWYVTVQKPDLGDDIVHRAAVRPRRRSAFAPKTLTLPLLSAKTPTNRVCDFGCQNDTIAVVATGLQVYIHTQRLGNRRTRRSSIF